MSEVHFTETSWYSAELVLGVTGRHSFQWTQKQSVKWDSDIKRVADVQSWRSIRFSSRGPSLTPSVTRTKWWWHHRDLRGNRISVRTEHQTDRAACDSVRINQCDGSMGSIHESTQRPSHNGHSDRTRHPQGPNHTVQVWSTQFWSGPLLCSLMAGRIQTGDFGNTSMKNSDCKISTDTWTTRQAVRGQRSGVRLMYGSHVQMKLAQVSLA